MGECVVGQVLFVWSHAQVFLGFLDGSTAVLLGELPRMILVFWISICARCSCSDGCLFVVLGVFLVVWFVEGSVI